MAQPPSPSASAPVAAGERWPALESTPEVFNQFMRSLGVPEDDLEFHDVYGLDDDSLSMVPQPVLAVILCFPDPPQDASDPPKQLLFSGGKETGEQVYFIKQIESLGNACGTVALLHAIGNASSEVSLVENSCLDLFFKSTASMDPYERAVFLEKDNAMARAHSLAASTGVTELSDVIDEHYICFVAINGKARCFKSRFLASISFFMYLRTNEELNWVLGTLYELDGMKDGPIKHGPSSSMSLLQDVVPVIKAIMRSIPNSINFNLMVLSRK